MNYTLQTSKYIRDVKCEAKIYVHNKTGARVAVMPADDTNRAISIAFSTPAENDKGIAHIIEHSVLCGSEKYPLKDPFVQLMKGSMYSFLNAMTYADFTVYPVASTNEKDFKNLADVYLDAAFNPLMPRKKEVFLQEGRHFEINEENDEVIGFNGVVFNEMKGAEGNVEMHIENAVTAALYKNTPYRFESGGLPTAIADLNYEELCDFYHRHYSASNCIIFLYGKIDEEEMLDYIDSEYLSKYEKSERYVVDEIGEDDFDAEVSAPYPANEEELEKGHYFSYNFALHIEHTPLNLLTLRVLDRVLSSSQGAYIKNAMQKAGIGEEFYSNIDEITKVPYFGFVGAKCREKDKTEFKRIIDDTLKELVENGIDKERLRSSIRILEFNEKEETEDWTPKGITYALQMMPRFLYDEENPLIMLEFFDAIDELKTLAETDYFEQFIKKYFLENNHHTFASVYPDPGFSEREDETLSAMCEKQLSQLDYSDIKADFELLNTYRYSEDTEEDAKKIPLLERSDLSEETEQKSVQHIALDGAELLLSAQNTNSIGYFNYYFDLRYIAPELLPYLRIFTELFGSMDTKEHSYQELSDLIDSYSGGIVHALSVVDGTPFGGEAVPYMIWHSRFLYENADRVFDINKEILLDTDFSDTAHIYDMLLQLKSSLTRDLLDSSHLQAKNIGLSAYSKHYAWEDQLKGYRFYKFLCDILNSFEEKKASLVNAMEDIRLSLFNTACWKYSFICEDSFTEKAKEMTNGFIALISDNEGKAVTRHEDIALTAPSAKAYCAPSQVQYAALCGMLPDNAKEKRGFINVASHLINTDYLWQNIRVLGGAYGCFSVFERSGEATMVSYRDPNLDRTLDVYRNSADFLKTLDINERTLRQFIIGAMNKLDKPKSPYSKGLLEINSDLTGQTCEDIRRVRRQMIHTSLDDIRSVAPLLEEWIASATETVIGNEQRIKSSDIQFDEINTLI